MTRVSATWARRAFRKLEALLPDDVSILGLDEHTACIIDLEKDEAVIRGLGQVTLRHRGAEMVLEKGESFPLAVLRGEAVSARLKQPAPAESVRRRKTPRLLKTRSGTACTRWKIRSTRVLRSTR